MKKVVLALESQGSDTIIFSSWQALLELNSVWNKQLFRQICNVKFVQERNILSFFGLKESELLKHSAVEQNLQVTACWHSKLDKIGGLGF